MKPGPGTAADLEWVTRAGDPVSENQTPDAAQPAREGRTSAVPVKFPRGMGLGLLQALPLRARPSRGEGGEREPQRGQRG